MNIKIKRLVTASVLLALALVLPLLTGQVPKIGKALCPMHFPVIICGYFCGIPYGVAVGIIAPLLRYLIFGMPVIIPQGLGMCFELATYALVASALYCKFKDKKLRVYYSLIPAIIIGRIVYGIAKFFICKIANIDFDIWVYFVNAIPEALPGIILQIILIPVLVLVLEKAFPETIKNS